MKPLKHLKGNVCCPSVHPVRRSWGRRYGRFLSLLGTELALKRSTASPQVCEIKRASGSFYIDKFLFEDIE
jgi:hypothetical protein